MFLTLALFAALTQQAEPRTVTISAVTPATALAPGSLPEQPREGERLICRTESVVGSNRRKRVCMTAEQRLVIREQSERFRSSINPNVGRPMPTTHEQILAGW